MTYISQAVEVLEHEFPEAEVSAKEDHITGTLWITIKLPGWPTGWMRPVQVDLAKNVGVLRTLLREDIDRVTPVITGQEPWAHEEDGTPLYVHD